MEAFNSTNGSDHCEVTSGSTWLTVFQTVFLILSLLGSLLLNASFTIVVIIHKALHQKDVMINLVLTVSNILYSVVTNVPSIVIHGGRSLGIPACYTIEAMSYFFGLLRYAFILAITVDRFGAVMYPFQYPKHSTKVATVIITIGSLNGAIVSICIHLLQCESFKNFCYVYNSLEIVMIFSYGIVVPLILNIIMFHKVKKLRTTVPCGTIENVEMVAPGSTETRSQDIRTMVTIALLIASVVGLTLPATIFLALNSLTSEFDATGLAATLALDLYLLVPVVDALVIWRNRDVKECAMSLCKRTCKIFKSMHL